MKLTTLLIGIFIVSALVIGMYTFANDLTDDTGYDYDVNNEYMSSFNKMDNVSTDMSNSYNTLQNMTFLDAGLNIYKPVLEVFSLAKNAILAPFSIANTMIIDFTNAISAPVWVRSLIVGVFYVMLLFALIAIILRFRDV